MKLLIIMLLGLATTSLFANCESKLRSGVQRKLQKGGKNISVSNIKIAGSEKIITEQGAFIREETRYDIEVLDGTLESYSGITKGSGSGCIVRYLQHNPKTLSF